MRRWNSTFWANVAIGVILAALVGVLAWLALREDYWLDEGFSLRRLGAAWVQLYDPLAIQPPRPADPFNTQDVLDFNPPLYFVLMRLLAGAHPGRLAARAFSIVPLAAGLLALALRARRESGPGAALALALVGATIPATLYFGHEVRPYALGVGVACLVLGLAWRWRARPRRLFAVCLLGAAAGALTHFAFAFWTIALFLLYAAFWLEACRRSDAPAARAALAAAAGLALGSALAVAVIVPQWHIFAETRHSSSMELSRDVMMNSFAVPIAVPVGRVGLRLVSPQAGFAIQFAVFLVLAWLLRRARRPRAGLCALWLWLGPLALTILARLAFKTTYYERYVLVSIPGWLLAMSWMVREARAQGRLERGLATGALGLVLLTNAWWAAMNLGQPLRSVWRPEVQYLKTHAHAGDYYALMPEFAHTFAANAGTPPPAKYFRLKAGLPREACSFWVLVETTIFHWPFTLEPYPLEPAAWRMEKVMETTGVALYHATRRQ